MIAFSGGPDSCALAALLAAPAAERALELLLVHVDHRLDAGSPGRAATAERLAGHLRLPFLLTVVDTPSLRQRSESPEAAARRLRYQALEAIRAERGATRILTAHHRDDLVETVLLQLLRGALIERLGGIPARRGAIRRPLLAISRAELLATIQEHGLTAIDDPTNLDLGVPRNRVRHHLLPRLRATDPNIDDAILALAARSAALRARIETLARNRFEEAKKEASIEGKDQDETGKAFIEGNNEDKDQHEEEIESGARTGLSSAQASVGGSGSSERIGAPPGLPVASSFLTGLPEPLRPAALRWLLETSGVARLPSFPSMEAFLSLVSRARPAALELPPEARRADAGSSSFPSVEGFPSLASGNRTSAPGVPSTERRLVARRGELDWGPPKSRIPPFSYTFSMPGEVELPELGLRLRIRRAPVEPWMLQGDRDRVGFESDSDRATVRSRTPGERMRPLGAPGSRKLKAILIDRGVPAEDRDRLPLLEVDGELAWVPGVALGERFALRGTGDCWLAELEALPGAAGLPAPSLPEASRSGERTES